MTKPLEVKVTLVTLLVCSVKVTKHRPLLAFHTLTCGDESSLFTLRPPRRYRVVAVVRGGRSH